MQASLVARNLACRRGERLLFAGLELDLQSGDICHVTGANGIGKSSLLRLLAGLLLPFEGRVRSSGTIALLNDTSALDPFAPLGKSLGFWAKLDDGPDALERVGLFDLADVPVRYLSTGQTKRAAFARVLAQGAAIWLLDEPLDGLDTASRETMLAEIDAHRNEGGLAVIASHQPLGIDARTLALGDFAA